MLESSLRYLKYKIMAKTKKEEIKEDVYAEVSALDFPLRDKKGEVKLEPVDEFSVFVKAKESTEQVWVKDHTLLNKVLGREFTLSGTIYLGVLR